MGTLHGNEIVNPLVKQIQLFVITYTTILGKKIKIKIRYILAFVGFIPI